MAVEETPEMQTISPASGIILVTGSDGPIGDAVMRRLTNRLLPLRRASPAGSPAVPRRCDRPR